MWKQLYSLQSSERLYWPMDIFWIVSTTPILYQHITDIVFRAIMKLKYNVNSTDEANNLQSQKVKQMHCNMLLGMCAGK